MSGEEVMSSGAPQQARVAQRFHVNIPLPAKLDLRGNLASNWKRFKRIWDNYEIASRLRNESKELRTAALLSCIGIEGFETYEGLEWANDDEKTDIDIVLEKLKTFYVGATNVIYERYNFNRRVQEPSESFEAYVVALRALAKSCNYGHLADDFIRDRIVVGVRENSLRKKLLQTRHLTLRKCIDICRASETTDQQLKSMSQTDEVHALCTKLGGKKNREPTKWNKGISPRATEEKNIHGVEKQSESEDEDYVLTVKEESVMSVGETKFPKRIFAHMLLNETIVKFQLDSGATANVLPLQLYREIFKDPELEHLKKTETTLVMLNK
ncbi:uncharacterized protein LOC114539296 [Dendronephthya gigantea]|uniref:uncharacterized protein LOC114539296 n=1 Tax=Dendronephthya gigantea TaxID=151771 RepID=UPI00106D0D76|nr:uncharacterized protein LOC114539296 [Dendronephthya gigantea]